MTKETLQNKARLTIDWTTADENKHIQKYQNNWFDLGAYTAKPAVHSQPTMLSWVHMCIRCTYASTFGHQYM